MDNLTPGELEVMQVLWNADRPLKPADIQSLFPRPIRNAALRSALLVLLDKGHVARRREGRAFLYSASTRPTRELRRMTRKLAELFCGGSTRELIAQMVRTERLSPTDIDQLRRIVEESERESS